MQGVFSFAEGLSSLAINDSEMALFSAAVLLCPERQGISDTKAITQHQERITDALRLQVIYIFFKLKLPQSHCVRILIDSFAAAEESRQ